MEQFQFNLCLFMRVIDLTNFTRHLTYKLIYKDEFNCRNSEESRRE